MALGCASTHRHGGGVASALGVLARVRVRRLGPSSLNRPHSPTRGRIPTSPHGGLYGCLRCTGAPRRPTSGSGLSLTIPAWHAVLYDPGEFQHRYGPVLRCRTWPSPRSERLGTPKVPAIRFTRGTSFEASGLLTLRPARLLAPLCRIEPVSRPQRAFTSRLPADWSPALPLDMTTTSTGSLCWRTLTRWNGSYPFRFGLHSSSGRSGWLSSPGGDRSAIPRAASASNASPAWRGHCQAIFWGFHRVQGETAPPPNTHIYLKTCEAMIKVFPLDAE